MPAPDHDSIDEHSLLEKSKDELKLTVNETEKKALSKSRIGQGKFRTRLKIFWKNSCAVTCCSTVNLLRASHIKPWQDSTNKKRLDEFNRVLLTPNLDAAFDYGLVSFKRMDQF